MKPSRFLALAGLLSLGSGAANAQFDHPHQGNPATLRAGVRLRAWVGEAGIHDSLRRAQPDGKTVDGIWKIGAGIEVQCAASRTIGETAFEMTMGPPVVANSEIRLKEVQFFPTGPQVAPVAERKYLDRFSSAEATRIGIELLFVNGSLANSVEVPIDCTYLTPTGNVLGTMNFVYQAVPSSPSGTAASGLGWDQPGRWSRGDYLAVCRIQGRPVSVDRFTVW